MDQFSTREFFKHKTWEAVFRECFWRANFEHIYLHGNRWSVASDHQISWDWGKCLIKLPAFSSRDHPTDLKHKKNKKFFAQHLSNHKAPASGHPGCSRSAQNKNSGKKKKNPPQALNTWAAHKPCQERLLPMASSAPDASVHLHSQLVLTVNISNCWMSLGTLWAEHWAAEHQPRLTNQSEMSRLSPSFLPWHPPECGFKLHKPQGVVVFVFSCRELFPSNALPDSCCD